MSPSLVNCLEESKANLVTYAAEIYLTRASITVSGAAISALIISWVADRNFILNHLEIMDIRGLFIDLHSLEMPPDLQQRSKLGSQFCTSYRIVEVTRVSNNDNISQFCTSYRIAEAMRVSNNNNIVQGPWNRVCEHILFSHIVLHTS